MLELAVTFNRSLDRLTTSEQALALIICGGFIWLVMPCDAL